MKHLLRALSSSAVLAALAATTLAQHVKVSAVAVDPADAQVIWVCNRENHSVSVIDTSTDPAGVTEIQVGIHPRSLAFSGDGTRVFVANQRGNIPLDHNAVTGFDPGAERGTVSVIDVASKTVTTTLTNVGVEPYGIAVAPSGEWFAVSGFRSGTMKFYDATTLTLVASHQFLRNLSFLPPGKTMADADANRDGIPDEGDPRGFVIRNDGTRIYVTHNKSATISVLDLTLDVDGLPETITELAKIDVDEYPFDIFYNPVPVQEIKSQGVPRFLEDIALSPNSTRLVVPHVLHNVNHDVNHDFGPGLAGDFANRVYPALTMIDAVSNTYAEPGDRSNRLHHELADDTTPGEYSSFGESPETSFGDRIVLGATGSPNLGLDPGDGLHFVVSGYQPGDDAVLIYGHRRTFLPFGAAGTLLVAPRFVRPMPNGQLILQIPDYDPLIDLVIHAQALVTVAGGPEQKLSNGLHVNLEREGVGVNKMGRRAGHPSRVAFNESGDRLLMLNRGSEDVFLYDVDGSDMFLRAVYPERLVFQERAPLDTSTGMGDLPLGMVVVPDPNTANDDALVYIINETTRTLSTLRVDYEAGTIQKERDQIETLTGPDEFTLAERIGEELFEDASRAQTSGRFNNSCASCHFEGGADGNVWQRPAGPRSTMPVYGGSLATGMVLWKAVRLHMGETGPMFGGENGGTGAFSAAEVDGLRAYHEKLAIPLNPNLDPLDFPDIEYGKDLFFGTNQTGDNPTMRAAGCANCHPMEVTMGPNPGPRFFTVDIIAPELLAGELETFDPDCFSLRENLLAENLRNVNTGANTDQNNDGVPESDRNSDGYVDLETYAIMNPDGPDPFRRDDVNNYQCPCDPQVDPNCDPENPFREFTRDPKTFTVPTKLGVFSSGPYFHDHVAHTLRTLLHPDTQTDDPVYGSPAFPSDPPFPGINKIFNDVHDIVGHTDLGGSSKVQLTLQTPPGEELLDVEAILEFIQSL